MRKIELKLKDEDLKYLNNFVKTGSHKSREVIRANVLLFLNEGKKCKEIEEYVKVSRNVIWKAKKRYLSEGLIPALIEKERTGQPRKYNPKHVAHLIALACTKAPEGRACWTVELITEEMRKLEGCETINRETVRLILKENGLKPWTKKNVVYSRNK